MFQINYKKFFLVIFAFSFLAEMIFRKNNLVIYIKKITIENVNKFENMNYPDIN